MELERGENMDKSIDTAEKFDNIQTVAEEFLEKPGGIRARPGLSGTGAGPYDRRGRGCRRRVGTGAG